MTIISLIVGVLFLFIALTMRVFKWYWLISGYNTASPEYKKNVDIEKVARLMGNTFFVVSAAWLVSALLTYLGVFLAIIPAAALTLLAVVFILIKAQKYDNNPGMKKRQLLAAICGAVLLIVMGGLFIFLYANSGEPEIKIESAKLSIGGLYGVEIPRENITRTEILEQIPNISGKSNGFEIGYLRKGYFNTKDWGNALVFLSAKTGPYLVIYHKTGVVIMNSADPEKIRNYFELLNK